MARKNSKERKESRISNGEEEGCLEQLTAIIAVVFVAAFFFFESVFKDTAPRAIGLAKQAIKESIDASINEFFGNERKSLEAAEVRETRYTIRQEFALVYNCIFESAQPKAPLTRAEYSELADKCAAELERLETEFPTFEEFAKSGVKIRAEVQEAEE